MSLIGDIGGFGAVADLLKDSMDKIWPDQEKRIQAEIKIRELDNQLAQGQMAINQVEAASNNLFVSGWRPFIGWVCGVAFAYHFILQPLMVFIAACSGDDCTPPKFDMDQLSTVLMGMLGLGGLRTIEKVKSLTK